MAEWFNPKSILASGGAGLFTTGLTEKLSLMFGYSPPEIAFALSFFFGGLAWFSCADEPFVKRLFFYVAASLVIFQNSIAGNVAGNVGRELIRNASVPVASAYAAETGQAPQPTPPREPFDPWFPPK